MAKILPLSDCNPDEYSHYFLDANVWIAFLKYNHKNKAEEHLVPYIDFFEAIVNLNNISDTKLLKKIKNKPKVVITSMLLSEMINTYMRVVAMPAFLNCKPGEGKFKKDYRNNKISDYDKQLKILLDDIQAYESMYELLDDDFNALNPMQMLNSLNREVDYNDLYYLSLMEKNNIAIVTDDGDFGTQNVNIFTCNNKLLKKA